VIWDMRGGRGIIILLLRIMGEMINEVKKILKLKKKKGKNPKLFLKRNEEKKILRNYIYIHIHIFLKPITH